MQVALLFPTAFWGARDMFGRVAPTTSTRGQFFLFYSTAGLSGGAMLVALVSGRAGVDFEQVRRMVPFVSWESLCDYLDGRAFL